MRIQGIKRIVATIAILVLSVVVPSLVATAAEKVTLCHATGQDDSTHFETLTIGAAAVYGPAGHFEDDGSPKAGHERDYLGECLEDQVTTTTTAAPEVTTTTAAPEVTTTTAAPEVTTTTAAPEVTTTTAAPEVTTTTAAPEVTTTTAAPEVTTTTAAPEVTTTTAAPTNEPVTDEATTTLPFDDAPSAAVAVQGISAGSASASVGGQVSDSSPASLAGHVAGLIIAVGITQLPFTGDSTGMLMLFALALTLTGSCLLLWSRIHPTA